MFSGSKIPLRKWMIALYLAATNKKGISSVQLGKQLRVTQRTAWLMLHKIRNSMSKGVMWSYPLRGTVELDETFVGGKYKSRRRHQYNKEEGAPKERVIDKAVVLGMVERGGRVMLKYAPNRAKSTVIPWVKGRVKPGSQILSDEYYNRHNFREYFYDSVKHSSHEYTKGDTHTNTIENVWSNLKRFIYGTHHWTSRHHLQSYLNEFMFRFNMRSNSDGVKVQQLIKQTMNGKFTYYDLTGRRQNDYRKNKKTEIKPTELGLNWDMNSILYPDGPY